MAKLRGHERQCQQHRPMHEHEPRAGGSTTPQRRRTQGESEGEGSVLHDKQNFIKLFSLLVKQISLLFTTKAITNLLTNCNLLKLLNRLKYLQ